MAFDDLEALVRADESESAQRSALKRRAITLLARREHSRAELTRKLLTPPPVRRRRRAGGRAGGPGDYEGSPVPDESFDRSFGARGGAASFDDSEGGNPAPRAPSPELVESVLDELEGMKLLSDRRMAESLVRNGAERFGRARLSQDLQRKGLDENLISNVLQPLAEDEKSRAQAVWQRRFGKPPTSLKEKARQYRFLVGRGFAPGVVSAVVPRIVDAPDEDDDSSAFDAGF